MTARTAARAFLREPLVHFLAAGAVLFLAYAWCRRAPSAPDAAAAPDMRIGAQDVAWLRHAFERQWQRPPAESELRDLVTELVKEELLAREARELGLDRDDPVVRRRLAQKVSFLVEDTTRQAEPPESALRRFHAEHADLFREEARVSFEQVFFDAAHDAQARRALDAARVAGAPTPAGDPSLLDAACDAADRAAVAGRFGAEFADEVFRLEPGAWSGPVRSAYGLHLVRVGDRAAGRVRDFESVRAQVLERWRDELRRESARRYFDALLTKYAVVVDPAAAALLGPLDAISPAFVATDEVAR